jgi:hypothetical protein
MKNREKRLTKRRMTILTDHRTLMAYLHRSRRHAGDITYIITYSKDEAVALQPESNTHNHNQSDANKQQNETAYQETNSKTRISGSGLAAGIAAIASLSGILFALFVFFGRVYAQGYFSALNIPFPAYRLELSSSDYAAGGWVPVSVLTILVFLAFAIAGIFWFAYGLANNLIERRLEKKELIEYEKKLDYERKLDMITIGIVGLLGLIFFLLLGSLNEPSARTFIFEGAVFAGAVLFLYKRFADYQLALGMILIGVLGLITLIAIFLLLPDWISSTSKSGEDQGHHYLVERSVKVEVLSKNPLSNALISTHCSGSLSNGDCFKYEDLYFLIYNGGHYFFFTGFGSDCKPKQVYAVSNENLISVNMLADQIVPVPSECKSQAQSVSTPRPPPSIPVTQQTGAPPASSSTSTP